MGVPLILIRLYLVHPNSIYADASATDTFEGVKKGINYKIFVNINIKVQIYDRDIG